jgi:hypothetical protein
MRVTAYLLPLLLLLTGGTSAFDVRGALNATPALHIDRTDAAWAWATFGSEHLRIALSRPDVERGSVGSVLLTLVEARNDADTMLAGWLVYRTAGAEPVRFVGFLPGGKVKSMSIAPNGITVVTRSGSCATCAGESQRRYSIADHVLSLTGRGWIEAVSYATTTQIRAAYGPLIVDDIAPDGTVIAASCEVKSAFSGIPRGAVAPGDALVIVLDHRPPVVLKRDRYAHVPTSACPPTSHRID